MCREYKIIKSQNLYDYNVWFELGWPQSWDSLGHLFSPPLDISYKYYDYGVTQCQIPNEILPS